MVNSEERAFSVSVRRVNRASELSTTTGAAELETVGTTTSALDAVTLGALGALAALGAAGTAAVDATAATTGAAVSFLVVFLSAGILFVLGAEVVEDILTRWYTSYLPRSCK